MADTTDALGEASERTAAPATGWRGSLFGLAAALCWAISPVFIRAGLKGLPSPLLGVTVGMFTSVGAYGLVLLVRRGGASNPPIPRDALFFQLLAGVSIGLATWVRWIALDLAPVAVVLALNRLSVPVVLLLAPLVVGQQVERVTLRVWLGAALIVGGSLLLLLYR